MPRKAARLNDCIRVQASRTLNRELDTLFFFPSRPGSNTSILPHWDTQRVSPWELVSLRVRWADGLWVTEVMNFDPELLKVRGMVLASGGERKWGNNVRNDNDDDNDDDNDVSTWVCVLMCVCVILTYEGLFGDDVLRHLRENRKREKKRWSATATFAAHMMRRRINVSVQRC